MKLASSGAGRIAASPDESTAALPVNTGPTIVATASTISADTAPHKAFFMLPPQAVGLRVGAADAPGA